MGTLEGLYPFPHSLSFFLIWPYSQAYILNNNIKLMVYIYIHIMYVYICITIYYPHIFICIFQCVYVIYICMSIHMYKYVYILFSYTESFTRPSCFINSSKTINDLKTVIKCQIHAKYTLKE